MAVKCNASTLAVNKFISEIKDIHRLKIGENRGVKFSFGENQWLIMETGDLFRYDLGEKLVLCHINLLRRAKTAQYVYRFNIGKGYNSSKHRDVVTKDLLWAFFGRCDLPKFYQVFLTKTISPDIPISSIGINDIDIRRKT